jgi:hypothetical protein
MVVLSHGICDLFLSYNLGPYESYLFNMTCLGNEKAPLYYQDVTLSIIRQLNFFVITRYSMTTHIRDFVTHTKCVYFDLYVQMCSFFLMKFMWT